jgi:hypothetical protein
MRIPPNSVACAAIVLGLVWGPFMPTLAQSSGSRSKPPIPTGSAPRLPSGRPDLNGVWERPYVPDMTLNARDQRGTAELPFTADGLADWKSYDARNGDYTGSCMPFGMTRSVNSPYPLQIVQNDKYVALLFEQSSWFHVVPIDGRSHPPADEIEPTWFGQSIGKWDGDTLVVDTVGFNGYTRLDTIGHPHSDALHLVQTFRRTDQQHLAYTVTIDDPKTYTKPWKNNKSLWEGRIKPWTPPARKK